MLPISLKNQFQTPSKKILQRQNLTDEKPPETNQNNLNKPISPPKHYYNNAIISDINIKSESSTHWPLQRKSPQKISRVKQRDAQLLKNAGNDLGEFIKKSNVVFKSAIAQINFQRLQKQSGEIRQSANLQRKSHLRKPPTPPRKRTINPIVNPSELTFSDNFESSNLRYAIRADQFSYYLVNRFDSNTRQNFGQWFYFRVKNETEYDQQYRMLILNMTKSKTFFGEGLKVSICRCGVWGKQGRDIYYLKNQFIRWRDHPSSEDTIRKTNKTTPESLAYQKQPVWEHKYYYSLAFTVFLHAHQELYVSYNQPYTYSRLYKHLGQISNATNKLNIRMGITLIGRSFLGNRIEMITFSKNDQNSKKDASEDRPKERSSAERNIRLSQTRLQYQKKYSAISNMQKDKKKNKKVVLVMARVHPIETGSSFIMQGFIDQIMQAEYTLQIMQQLTIKVIPMINPDGVIMGNSKSNAKGYNLNRQWKTNSPGISPELICIKSAIDKIKSKIVMVIDLHSHSKHKNTFFLGCQGNSSQPSQSSKQFVYLMSQLLGTEFVYSKSKWSDMRLCPKQKEGSARISLWRRLKTDHVFTLQTSECSAEQSNYHYDENEYKNIGRKLLETIIIFYSDRKQIGQGKYHNTSQFKVSRSKGEHLNQGYQESESQIQQRILSEEAMETEQDIDIRIKSRQGSSSKLRKHYNNRVFKGVSADKSKLHRDSNHSKVLRKKTQFKITDPNERQTSINRKSVKSFEQKNKISVFRTLSKDQNAKGQGSPIRIPRIPCQSEKMRNKNQKSTSYEPSNRPGSLRKAIVNSVNRVSSRRQLKPIVQSSAQIKKSETQNHSQLDSLTKTKINNYNGLNELTISNDQENSTHFLQRERLQVEKSPPSEYQILKAQSKVYHPRINEVIYKINNPK